MSPCPTEEQLIAVHTGTAPPEEVEAVRAHAGGCPQCSAWLAEAEEIDEAFEGMRAALGTGRAPGADALQPREIGPYRLMKLVGEGAMGEVWRAAQRSPLRRIVAVKLVKPGLETREIMGRFEVERQALARMNHPNVAAVYDAGLTDRGRPYFVMEYVRGEPITGYCDQRRLTVEQRLGLFVEVCGAIQHAHQKGTIHRDIKPSNVLVTDRNGHPSPKVIDFGIAKAVDQRRAERTVFTEQGQIIGTPEHMSPEQAGTTGLDIDSRTDVYSLGVLLYELLVGQKPLDRQVLLEKGYVEFLRIVREVDPPRPSTRLGRRKEDLAAAAQSCRSEPRTLFRKLRGDLDWIVMQAMEKDRERRYASASELAADVDRYLRHEPVLARPPSVWYRLGKFVRKHRVGVAVTVALAVMLVGATGVSLSYWRRAEWASYVANIQAADGSLRLHDAVQAESRLNAVPASRRGTWEWRYLQAHIDDSVAVFRGGSAPVMAAAFVPSAGRLVAAANDGTVWAGDPEKAPDLRPFGQETERPGRRLAVSADGSIIATGGSDKIVRLWDARTGAALGAALAVDSPAFSAVRGVDSLAISSDGVMVVAGFEGEFGCGFVAAWYTATGERVFDPVQAHDWPVHGIVFSPDGRRIYTAGEDGNVGMLDSGSGAILHRWSGESRKLQSIAVSPDGAYLATGGKDGAVRVWDANTGKEQGGFGRHGQTVMSVAFSPGGRLLASASSDKTIKLWRIEAREELATLVGHSGVVNSVAFRNDGKLLISASADGTVRLWRPAPPEVSGALRPPQHDGEQAVEGLAFSGDGRRLAAAGRNRTITVWDLAARETPVELPEEAQVQGVGFLPGGRIVAGLKSHGLSIWDPITRQRSGFSIVGVADAAGSLAVAGEGSWAGAVDGNTVRLWKLSGEPPRAEQTELLTSPARAVEATYVADLAFSGDGERLAAVSDSGALTVWRLATPDRPLVWANYDDAFNCIAFHPRGALLAVGCESGAVRLMDAASGRERGRLLGHSDNITSVGFNPDGSRLAAGSRDGTIKLWDVGTGVELLTLRGHGAAVTALCFSRPDGWTLASGDADGAVRLWETERPPVGPADLLGEPSAD